MHEPASPVEHERITARRWFPAVPAVFLTALLVLFGEVWWAGPATHTPVERIDPRYELLMLMDHRYVTWAVSRNAWAMIHEPMTLFDAEACFPAPKSLALGEPALTLGLLGVVPYALTADPELTYNAAFALLVLAGMLAMFVLVYDWSGSVAAGLVAALFYEFGRARLGDPMHPYVSDLSWGVFAMFFARRLFLDRRWRDALGLALSLALQFGASAYAQVAVMLVGVPFAAWLLATRRSSGLAIPQLVFVTAVTAAAVALVVSPYLALSDSGSIGARTEVLFAFPFYISLALLDGSPWMHGVPRILLAIVGLSVPRRWVPTELPRGLRSVLLLGGLLSVAVSMGPGFPMLIGLPAEWNLWAALVAVLPPLTAVRVPAAILMGGDLVVTIFAGFGVAAILSRLRGNAARLASVALIAIISVEVLGCWFKYRYRPFRLQPEPEQIQFFDELAQRGNRGPIFEWPNPPFEGITATRMTLATYHHRETSTCLASFRSPQADSLRAASLGLPRRDSLLTLVDAGFTTLLVHHDAASWETRIAQFLPETSQPDGLLRMIHTTPQMTAYAIELPGAVSRSGRDSAEGTF